MPLFSVIKKHMTQSISGTLLCVLSDTSGESVVADTQGTIRRRSCSERGGNDVTSNDCWMTEWVLSSAQTSAPPSAASSTTTTTSSSSSSSTSDSGSLRKFKRRAPSDADARIFLRQGHRANSLHGGRAPLHSSPPPSLTTPFPKVR